MADPTDTRSIAMAAQAHINRHEETCSHRWQEARASLVTLTGRVDELVRIIGTAQLFAFKSGLWLIAILASGLVGTIWWIMTHPQVQP